MSRNLKPILACRIVIFGLIKPDIEARQDIPEFFTANLWSTHVIALEIDRSWNIFFSHNFCSMLMEKVIDLRKLRTGNLKFRKDLRNWVIDDWLVRDDYFGKQIAQKIFNSKIEARPVSAGLYTAFKRSISFATDLAANFGCNQFRTMPEIVSTFLRTTICSRCAVSLKSEQKSFSWTGRRFRSAALHRPRFGTCKSVPMPYFCSETNEWSKDWAKRRERLWSVKSSREIHQNSESISHVEKNCR